METMDITTDATRQMPKNILKTVKVVILLT